MFSKKIAKCYANSFDSKLYNKNKWSISWLNEFIQSIVIPTLTLFINNSDSEGEASNRNYSGAHRIINRRNNVRINENPNERTNEVDHQEEVNPLGQVNARNTSENLGDLNQLYNN